MKAIGFYLILAGVVGAVLTLARIIPDTSETTMRDEAADLIRTAFAFGKWLWHTGKRMKRGKGRRGIKRVRKPAAGPCDANRPDHDDITEAEHQQAVTYLIRKYGKVPPSLQRVIDRGGRIGLPQRKQATT